MMILIKLSLCLNATINQFSSNTKFAYFQLTVNIHDLWRCAAPDTLIVVQAFSTLTTATSTTKPNLVYLSHLRVRDTEPELTPTLDSSCDEQIGASRLMLDVKVGHIWYHQPGNILSECDSNSLLAIDFPEDSKTAPEAGKT